MDGEGGDKERVDVFVEQIDVQGQTGVQDFIGETHQKLELLASNAWDLQARFCFALKELRDAGGFVVLEKFKIMALIEQLDQEIHDFEGKGLFQLVDCTDERVEHTPFGEAAFLNPTINTGEILGLFDLVYRFADLLLRKRLPSLSEPRLKCAVYLKRLPSEHYSLDIAEIRRLL